MNARPGRHLAEVPARAFLDNAPRFVGALAEGDWTLMPTTRPYLARNGTVTARLVLRRRNSADTLVVNWTLRGAIGDALMDALVTAMGPAHELPR